MASTKQTTRPDSADEVRGNATFLYEVDGTTYEHDHPKITGAEIMAEADIDVSDGLVQLLEDSTTASITPSDEVKLVPKPQFKRRPRFKRG